MYFFVVKEEKSEGGCKEEKEVSEDWLAMLVGGGEGVGLVSSMGERNPFRQKKKKKQTKNKQQHTNASLSLSLFLFPSRWSSKR
jgi:choline-glycine betaine transporter